MRRNRAKDALDALATFAIVNADGLGDALTERLGEFVNEAVADEGESFDKLDAALGGHLICFVLGFAAVAMLDMESIPDDVGDAISETLKERGVPALYARLAGAATARALDIMVKAHTGQLSLMFCCAAPAWCPDDRRHPGPPDDVMARCDGKIAGTVTAEMTKDEMAAHLHNSVSA